MTKRTTLQLFPTCIISLALYIGCDTRLPESRVPEWRVVVDSPRSKVQILASERSDRTRYRLISQDVAVTSADARETEVILSEFQDNWILVFVSTWDFEHFYYLVDVIPTLKSFNGNIGVVFFEGFEEVPIQMGEMPAWLLLRDGAVVGEYRGQLNREDIQKLIGSTGSEKSSEEGGGLDVDVERHCRFLGENLKGRKTRSTTTRAM